MTVMIRDSQRSLKANKRPIRQITEDLLTFLKLQDRDLSILFVDNRQIQKMNKKFFGKDQPTNVISFSYLPPSGAVGPEFPCEIIGDIVISLERAQEEASSLNVPFYERVFALIIHGILHILGFDHVNDSNERRRMRYQEKKLLTYVATHRIYKEITL
ncbi:MAG: rRNA maturation RNase YbeY [Syntrophus sp. (in: bacteria)]|nr:rRNA maturation RNase YbeY [Syntrophus sp. (in: bacteria)]